MSPDEFDACLAEIGWSELQAARRLNIPQTTLRRIAHRGDLPEPQANYLRTIVQFLRSLPVPDLQ